MEGFVKTCAPSPCPWIRRDDKRLPPSRLNHGRPATLRPSRPRVRQGPGGLEE